MDSINKLKQQGQFVGLKRLYKVLINFKNNALLNNFVEKMLDNPF